jgi:hypothetical protein
VLATFETRGDGVDGIENQVGQPAEQPRSQAGYFLIII